ncbi:hypothetical protein [Actinoplanes solisilvae]|uniref:hypothetical protein n=1 Tax=Actinoplanes solisilvae TaxID=2486853 RepID=UPI000FDA0767|nr:hypothetical protein [Actinoplanes solisilvae]
MKRATLALGLSGLAGLVLFTGACGSGAAHLEGSAVPFGASPAPSTAPVSPASAPVVTATSASPSAPAATTKPATTEKPQLGTVIGPRGLGAVRLGMSMSAASATGLIGKWVNPATGATTPEGGGCSMTAPLKEAPSDDATVYGGKDRGIIVISAYGRIRTPEGIRIGSSKAALLEAYPTWRPIAEENPEADGRGLVAVPGNSKANYRIATVNGKVAQLALQFKTQDCYE